MQIQTFICGSYAPQKVVVEGQQKYRLQTEEGERVFQTKKAYRRVLSYENGGAWVEEKDGKNRYFIDDSEWFQTSYKQVSKNEFYERLDAPSTWQKVLGVGLGILALAPGVSEFVRHVPKEAGLGLLALRQKNPLLGALSCFPSLTNAQAVGTEFQVNTNTIDSQHRPSSNPQDAVMITDGGFIVVWESFVLNGNVSDLAGQRYNLSGIRKGAEFKINTFSPSDQSYPAIATLNNGGFVVVWNNQGQDGDSGGIFGQIFDAFGEPTQSEFQINSFSANAQDRPSVEALEDGGGAVFWNSNLQDGSSYGIYGQRFDSNSSFVGKEFRVNTRTQDSQATPNAFSLPNEQLVVTWHDSSQDGSGWGIFAQIFDSDLFPIGSEFQVNNYTSGSQLRPKGTSINGDGFVIVWHSDDQDGSNFGVFGQRYNLSASKVGLEFQVNSFTAGSQMEPSLARLLNGGFVVVWESEAQDGSGTGIFGQRYTSGGSSIGSEFQVNTYTNLDQHDPTVTSMSDGGFIVIWTSDDQDGGYQGVFGQRYSSNGTPMELILPTSSSSSSVLSSNLATSATTSSSAPSTYRSTTSSSPKFSTSSQSTSKSSTKSSLASSQSSVSASQSSDSGTSLRNSNSEATNSGRVLSSSIATSATTSSSTLVSTTTSFSTQASSSSSSDSLTSSTTQVPAFEILSVSNLVYDVSYDIVHGGIVIGTFTISGGDGPISSNFANELNFQFDSSYTPEVGKAIPLFSIPEGEESMWETVVFQDKEVSECIKAYGEVNQYLEKPAFELIFEGADTCLTSAPKILASLVPIITN